MGGVDINVDATPLSEITQNFDYHGSEEWALRARASHLTVSGIQDVNLTAARRKSIAKLSGRATNDLVDRLGLSVDDLPSLVLLRKDFNFSTKQPALVLRTRGRADAEFLVEFIRAVRRLSEEQIKAAAQLEFARDADWERALSKEIDKAEKLQMQAERQAAFLGNVIRTFDVELDSKSIVINLLSAANAREGIERAFAEVGITAERLLEIEKSDHRVKNVCGALQKTRQRIDHLMHDSEKLCEYVRR